MINATLSGYCIETSCHNNHVNDSTFTPDLCNSSYCKVEKVLVPTVPDINDRHWFFDYVLYIGGSIHLFMSLVMVIYYFLVNKVNFVLPDLIRRHIENSQNVFVRKAMTIPILGTFLKRHSTYSDEPLPGIRSIYHIVSIITGIII